MWLLVTKEGSSLSMPLKKLPKMEGKYGEAGV